MSVCLSFSNLANAPWSLVRSHHLKRMRLALVCYKLERNVILGVNSIKKQLTNICQRPNSPTKILEIILSKQPPAFFCGQFTFLWSIRHKSVKDHTLPSFLSPLPPSLLSFFLSDLSLSLSLSPFRFPFRLYDVLPNK